MQGSTTPNELKWKMWFRRHNSYVKATVPPEQLLVFNISEVLYVRMAWLLL